MPKTDEPQSAKDDVKSEMSLEQRRLQGYYQAGFDWKRGAVPVSDLLPKLVDPIYAGKGLSSSALIAAWPELVGPSFVDCAMIESIKWPYQKSTGETSYQGGILVVRVDGPKAVYLQHEERQILERVNQFFGFSAITRLKITQGSISKIKKIAREKLPNLSKTQEAKLRDCVAEFDDPDLNEAVLKLGQGVLQRALSNK
ncbi:MAG: DciA family protein [Hyphomicrobiales bacterium]